MVLVRVVVLQQRVVQHMWQHHTAALALALAQQRTVPAWLPRMALALVQVLQQRTVQPMRQQYTAALALVQQRAMRCWLRCGLTS